MQHRFASVFLIVAAALLAVLAAASSHASAGVRELRTTPQTQSAPGVDYMLHVTSVGGAMVTLIDVHSGAGDWVRANAAKLPPVPAADTTSKDAPQWFYGEVVGWMPVPQGWRVQHAAIGADGNTLYTFVAPEGASAGWITYTVIPACESCLLEETEGLLPGAGERLGSQHNSPGIDLGQTNPVMSWQSRPDDCTALFRYRSGGLTVHAAVLSSVPVSALEDGKGDVSVADLYVGLPDRKASLAGFLQDHFRQAFPACHSPRGFGG
ncbi:hypothetical protein DVT68_10310 [Dyella solisilvae]|uniref:DUF4850 domain-containing protein n=1 Tax=Dyella solisilvae TaxID=1920168 RepID=A0A370K8C2_9GAMM|nr:hypothetical protein [Dyella solisilvae]RDI98889.1 hypothetical protein DVT68_10310 [Dyella solisilvae]